jgi:hypothetical protein
VITIAAHVVGPQAVDAEYQHVFLATLRHCVAP